jgi:5'-3' exonuclease
MSISLIDGDLVAFTCAASANKEEEWQSWARVNDLMKRILDANQSTSFTVYLTGKNNFRRVIDTAYKANRKDKELPIYLDSCRELLVHRWGARIVDGMEADDAMGIEQCQSPHNDTVICSLDKDMLMIPGEHYNWRKEIYTQVDNGFPHFFQQLLIGDTSDNVKGIYGLGPVKAKRLIPDDMEDEAEMFEIVRDLYDDDKRLLTNCALLWIHRDKGQTWIHRSKSLLKQVGLYELGQEVLAPLSQSPETVFLELGLTESSGIEAGGTTTEATG